MGQNFTEAIKNIRRATRRDLNWSIDLDCYILKIIPIPSTKFIWVVASEQDVFLVNCKIAAVIIKLENIAEFIFAAVIHPKSSEVIISTSRGVHQLTLEGEVIDLVTEENWFEHLAISDDGSVLFASKGKMLYIIQETKEGYKLAQQDTLQCYVLTPLLGQE